MLALPAISAAHAQQIPDAGRLLEQTKPLPTLPQPSKSPAAADDRSGDAAPEGPRIRIARVRITGARHFSDSELQALVAGEVGKELSLGDLRRLAARITHYYRQHGYLLARAYLPAQEVKDGEIEIAVLEGTLDNIKLNNGAALGGEALSPVGNLSLGAAAQDAVLERNLLLLSDLPGVQVQSTLRPGGTVGATDLLIDVKPGPRFAGSLELDNFGDRFSGQNRLGATIYVNNPLQIGDQASFRMVGSDGGMRYVRFGYQLPVNRWGTRMGAAGSYMHYELGENLKPLGAQGQSRIGSLYLQHPLIRSRSINLFAQLQFDRLDLEDRMETVGTKVEKSLNNWNIGLGGDLQDGLGAGAVNSFSATYTTGKVKLDPVSMALDTATARTAGQFHKWSLSWLRLQQLTSATSLYASLNAQTAGKNLDSSAKISLGGINGVRAYPQGEALGDEALLATLELRHRLPVSLPGLWQATVFVDHGEIRTNKNPWMQSSNAHQLSGAGVGLLGGQGKDWSIKGSLAWRLGSERPKSEHDRFPRAWIQIAKYY